MLACFKQSGNSPLGKELFTYCVKISKVNLYSFKIFVRISPPQVYYSLNLLSPF